MVANKANECIEELSRDGTVTSAIYPGFNEWALYAESSVRSA
jgi:hypothetical protein